MDTMWHCKCEHGKDFVVMSAEVYFVSSCVPCESILTRLSAGQRATVAKRIAKAAASAWGDTDTLVDVLNVAA
jgi:hypothetical protein